MRQTTYKKLPCDLTDDEIRTYSNELAAITTTQSEIEAEKKEVMSDFTAKLNKCLADARVLARKITTRKEDREVECELDFDYVRKMVYTVRCDTGVTIDQRKMLADELQAQLDFEAKNEADEDKPAEIPADSLPEEPAEGVTFCNNTSCPSQSAGHENGCGKYEHAWECPGAVGEVVSVEPQADDVEVKITLDASYFVDNGPLVKSRPTEAGVPGSGKLRRIFEYDDRKFYLTGSMCSGAEGYTKFWAYVMVPRDQWPSDTCTVKERVDSYDHKTPLIHTGCICTFGDGEYVLGSRFVFERPVTVLCDRECPHNGLDSGCTKFADISVCHALTAEEIVERDATCNDWPDCKFSKDCFAQEVNPEANCLLQIDYAKKNGLYCKLCDNGYFAPDHIVLVKHYRAVHKVSLKEASELAIQNHAEVSA